ncbi:MAG: hypothetical protein WBL35_09170 [Ornithinibacter sp.]
MRPDQAIPQRRLEHLDRAPCADRWFGELVDEPFHERLKTDDSLVDVHPPHNVPPATASNHTVDVATWTGLTELERGQVKFMSNT